jgi:hypothetical protein
MLQRSGRREESGISQDHDGKVNCGHHAKPCGGRDLRRTRDLAFPMVRISRMYEVDHLHFGVSQACHRIPCVEHGGFGYSAAMQKLEL